MKKLLLITYYWPPSGGGGVVRWMKFVKYLREFGWEPIVYTPEGGEAPVIDDSLLEQVPEGLKVIKQPIWEPYSLYKRVTGKKKDQKVYSGFISEGKKPSFAQRASVWIRGNFFIPDARKFWIKPSIRYLKKYLRSNPVDVIISTGPPHSMHMIALALKKEFGIPWVADFRDPWTNIDFYDQLMLTKWADKQHHKMEQEVLHTADKVVTVTWSWAEELTELGNKKTEVITNGFDDADFNDSADISLDKQFSIIHIGSMNGDRNPKALWKVLKELSDEDQEFKRDLKLILIGQVDFSILSDAHKHGFEDNLEKLDYLPHREAMNSLRSAQLLLLPLNNTPNISGVVPGKLFEYLGSKRPILCIGSPDGDAARIIKESNGGSVSDFDDLKALKANVLEYYQAYKAGNLNVDSRNTLKYSRKLLARDYADLLNGLL